MAKNYYNGDVEIVTLQIISERAVIELKSAFQGASIYESVFTPGIVCDIEVIDTNDLLGSARLLGDEIVLFDFKVMGSEQANYRFALYSLGDLQNVGAQSGKGYVLKCVSEESMFARTNYVSKSYDALCSEIVEDLHKNFLRSEKPIVTERTAAPQKIVIPNLGPYEAIKLVKQRAVSADTQSLFYLFFENRIQEQQTFNFTTIDTLFAKDSVKDFKMDDTQNKSVLVRGDDNILAFKIPTQLNSIDRINYTGPTRVTTFNFTTWEYESKVVRSDSFQQLGGDGVLDSPSFVNRYFNTDRPSQVFVPVDISQRPSTQIPEAVPNTQQLIGILLQNSIKIKVIGDTVLTAGVTINCTLPNRQGFTGPGQEDPLMTGKFLITRLHHRIGKLTDKPRYTCSVEAIKGRYEE